MKPFILSLAFLGAAFSSSAYAELPKLEQAMSRSIAAQTQLVKQQFSADTLRSSLQNLAAMRAEIPYRVVVYAVLNASNEETSVSPDTAKEKPAKQASPE
ncbi:hypothetical protein PSI9734_02335 [Pseudidiomarina piscicola]|uniref:Uncharacterized protein n=1 Tax=Pseudidiomarina piscicola TaxID=2614830 RepID=A0A6S6WRL8_9GAMM|nr:hypothetical protein [Pseudidiomarina piscicola]CAB0151981.1 hypothetical protein PSI9734_02335 [Pseudidiomarina piscicola]VZT41419.1 hypothetical protein PSI9734_02335 [Pseudomonas aeruginosa]